MCEATVAVRFSKGATGVVSADRRRVRFPVDEAENPALLSDNDESVAPGQVSWLWARIHSLETQLWGQSRAIDSFRASQADESACPGNPQ